MQYCSESHTGGSILLYVTGCLEEAGIILVRTAFDEDMTETFIIFIDDINSFYDSLDQCDQNLQLRRFCKSS